MKFFRPITDEDYDKCYKAVAEPTNKIAILEHSSLLAEIHNKKYRSGVSSIKILDQKVETYFRVFTFMPLNPFVDFFNQIMAELAAGGFLSYWRKLEINPKDLKTKIEDIGPQVLTLEQLEIAFYICLAPFAVCALVFAFEVAFKHFRKTKLSVDRTDGSLECRETVEQFECQTIENNEEAIIVKPQMLSKLETLKLFENNQLESLKPNCNEIELTDTFEDYLSLFGDLISHYDE